MEIKELLVQIQPVNLTTSANTPRAKGTNKMTSMFACVIVVCVCAMEHIGITKNVKPKGKQVVTI